MRWAAGSLKAVGAEVGWLELPGLPPKGDVSDWFAADPRRCGADFLRLPIGEVPGVLSPVAHASVATGTSPEAAAERDLIRLEELTPLVVGWLWYGWLPVGKLCLLDGDPGQGKSYVTLDLAARLSRGDAFPDGSPGLGRPVTTLLVSCEDGVRDTVLPRLIALGADLKHVRCYLGEMNDGQLVRLPKLPDDLPAFEAVIRASGAKLVVIDPLMAFLAESVLSISDQSVRGVLAPLAALAERLGVTFLFVRHLNKTNGKQAIYRGGGSIGITAAMRSSMLIGRHPHDAELRVLAMVKCNLEQHPVSLGFGLEARGDAAGGGITVAWKGPVEMKANDLVGDVKEALSPKDWLRAALADGPRLASELEQEAEEEGISRRTLQRAKAALSVVAKQKKEKGGRQSWYWLPPGLTDFPRKVELPPMPGEEGFTLY
jgi:hypothetical protein